MTDKTPADNLKNKQTIWVDGTKKACTSDKNKMCFNVKREGHDDSNQAEWNLVETPIIDFTFEPGHLYKVVVAEDVSDGEKVWRVLKKLEKNIDGKLRLHDLWSLRKVKGKELVLEEGDKRPFIELHISDMMIRGNGNCNDLSGKILEVDDENIVFDRLASTKKMCPNMHIEKRFIAMLGICKTYLIKDMTLRLMDKTGQVLLEFRKVD